MLNRTIRPRQHELDNALLRIRAAREGGSVSRAHALRHHGAYDVAQHSYNAVSLLLILHPDPSLNLIKALMWHDVAERWLGDIPAPAKRSEGGKLGEVYETAEDRILTTLGMAPDLTEEETNWLRSLDTLELYMWCREERFLGNRSVDSWIENCTNSLIDRYEAGCVPEVVYEFFIRIDPRPIERLGDYFDAQVAPLLRDE